MRVAPFYLITKFTSQFYCRSQVSFFRRTCRVKTVLHPLIQNGHDIDKPVDLTADSDDENSDVIVLDELEEKKSQTSDDETDPCTISYIVFDTMRNKSLTVTASEMK